MKLIYLVTALIATAGIAGCSTPAASTTPAPAEVKGANAPTTTACRTVATDPDVTAIRVMLKGSTSQAGSHVAPALATLVALRTSAANTDVNPDVATALRTTSEQATALKDKLQGYSVVVKSEWAPMIAETVTACTMAGVDMGTPQG